MKKNLLSILLLFIMIAGSLNSQSNVQFGFDFSKKGTPIGPDLYGIFFEDINFAADGGIYAELIRNRSFDDGTLYWTFVSANGSKGKMSVQSAEPLNSVQKKYLQIQTDTIISGTNVSVRNTGFWGINVVERTEYKLSFFAKASNGFNGVVTASLTDKSGAIIYAQHRVTKLSNEWKKYTCSFVANGNDPAAIFSLSLNSAGIVSFDLVSLFPPTYKNRPNGMRIDLVQKLIDLKPKVMRFPGGSFVNGVSMSDRFLWKNTIGNIEDRSGHTNQWGYKTTNGMGFHEFLQLSEDLGAIPLYVFNCGISNSNVIPYNQLDTLIKYELEAIEYANGPVTSKYGAMRAANGHPEPFNIKYLEVGNESNQPASDHYGDRYIQFYNAIKAKYPDMVCIGDLAWGTDEPTWDYSHPVDLIDEHYYRSPEWFLGQSSRYDSYSRTGPKIYVGEYAVTTNGGKGNLAAALGEAAFMTGIERNADIIPLAAYAPLLGNVNQLHWQPDLIYFDSKSSFGTPSFHVQKLFAHNTGTKYIPYTEANNSKPTSPQFKGAIGLGSWSTQVKYDSIKVVSGDSIIIDEKFDNNAAGWNVVNGTWSVKDGVYQQTGSATDCRSTFGNITLPAYTITLKALKYGGGEGFLILWAGADNKNFYWWNIGGWGNTQDAIQQCVNGSTSAVLTKGNKIASNVWYNLKIDVNGDTTRCYLNDSLMFTYKTVSPKNNLYTSCTVDSLMGDIYLKVINYNDNDQIAKISLKNLPANTKLTGTLDILTHPELITENVITAPNTVVPVTSLFSTDTLDFDYTSKSHSLSVFHLYPKSSTLKATDAKFSVPENSVNGTKVGNITATGAAKFKYSILNSSINGAFAINDSTGEITVKDNQWLNYEKDSVISVNISVKDASNDLIVAARCVCTVNITDMNEKPSLVENKYYVVKNEPVGNIAGTVFVKDEDKNQTYAYSIKSQSIGNLLSINSATGELTLSALPASVSVDKITFIVNVADNGNPSLADEKEYTLEIMEIPSLVSVRKVNKTDMFEIFPNPANNYVQVKSKGQYRNVNLNIFDSKGAIVRIIKINQEVTIINTSQLPNGLYNIQIISNEEVVGNSHLIIQK